MMNRKSISRSVQKGVGIGIALIAIVIFHPHGAFADTNERLGATVKGMEIPVLDVTDTGMVALRGRIVYTEKRSAQVRPSTTTPEARHIHKAS